jgi:anti-sigma factor (TIGR02949 family)
MTGANEPSAADREHDCTAALKHLHIFLDGECGASIEQVIIRHLHACLPCEQRTDFERELRIIIAAKCKDVAPSGLLERILSRLHHRGE